MLNHIATKAKAYAALLGSVLTAAAGVFTDNKWLALAAAILTAITVYRVPNGPANDADETGAVSVATACLVVIAAVMLLGWFGVHGHAG